jgi:hypothetical protein
MVPVQGEEWRPHVVGGIHAHAMRNRDAASDDRPACIAPASDPAALGDPGSLILFSSCPDPPLGQNQRLPMGAVNNLTKKPSALSPLMKARSAAG